MLEPERHMIYSALIVVLLASNLISIGSDADLQGGSFQGGSNGGPQQSNPSVSIDSSSKVAMNSGSLQSQASSSISSSGSIPNGKSLSTEAGAQGIAGGNSGSAQASASLSFGSSTPKPEGILGKFKDMLREGKDKLVGKKEEKTDAPMLASVSAQAASSGPNRSGSAEGSASINLSSPNSNSPLSSSSEAAFQNKPSSAATSSSASLANGSSSASASSSIQLGSNGRPEEKREGVVDKMSKLVNKGTDAIKDTVHKVEDKAHQVGDKVAKAVDEHITKPIQSATGSGQMESQGSLTVQASANAQLKGDDRDRHLLDEKHKQENDLGSKRPTSLKDVISNAKAEGVIPQNEDRSALKGNHADEKSMAVEMFDKAHEISKIPAENALKPIDKMLGFEKDPLLRMYDNSHEILRKPLSLMAKPVESVLTGAFKTSDEAKKDSEKLLTTASIQEQRDAKAKEERERKENRSVAGQIADKTLELATKPIEIVLRPLDHALGLDKDGKKNPLIQLIDEIYSLSKKPLDTIAKPFESVLRKMAEPVYQVSIKFNATEREINDPQLFTRLADGVLNIADRVLTKPLEMVMKPIDHAFGYDEPGKKNPIVEAAHQLKNATKVGMELFTRPIDRIIKEVAEIGANKSDAERDAEYERSKEEASRFVKALDMIHSAAQTPFEIVLRPVSKALGMNKDGRKEPLLRAWDIIHQVIRTPIQVISKPVEEALWGESKKPRNNQGGLQASATAKSLVSADIGGVKAGASVSLGRSGSAQESKANKKNIFIDGIKKVEKFAARPFEVITSPIRRLILGEDNEKVGSATEKSNREAQAKAKGQTANGQNSVTAQLNTIDKKPDKIMSTIEKINNLALKPLEEITQPISEILSPSTSDEGKSQTQTSGKVEVKAQAQSSSSGNQIQAQAKVQANESGQREGTPMNGNQRLNPPQESLSASAAANASFQQQTNKI